MGMEYTAIITKDEDWWLGWIKEIPGANAQERTKEELLISLKEAARDIIELRWQQAISELKSDYEEIALAI
ncbi:MAG: type II toxin-antitoxin system HicB family antitoxin [Desulfamplus sp.]|nr:type II toxin-antitoxin system HicB family antitoxin [Desulfamplus sp.]MBF0259978.1 type II toxin-antitoxin system HicB family antitoxin [Desulfamplus sp.]